MLKDYMLAPKAPSLRVPAGGPDAQGGSGADDEGAEGTPGAAVGLPTWAGQGTCVVSLADGGTDVSTVVHLVHPIEVHATVEADLASGSGPALDMTLPAATTDTPAGLEASSAGVVFTADRHLRGA